jgi:hypothetical protein
MWDILSDLLAAAIPKGAEFGCMMASTVAMILLLAVLIWLRA